MCLELSYNSDDISPMESLAGSTGEAWGSLGKPREAWESFRKPWEFGKSQGAWGSQGNPQLAWGSHGEPGETLLYDAWESRRNPGKPSMRKT